jgi:putative membrane protein insertion efficiency factor
MGLWMSFSKSSQQLGKILNPLAKTALLFLVSFYRIVLSPFLGGACRFEPSCSVYAEQALKEHTVNVAIPLIIKRVLSCRPGGRFGFDPVPHCGCHHE